jgi:hypothetical protein
MVEWEIHGLEFGNCNCAYGCPCQFNDLPTHGNCQAIGFFRIDKGHFGKTPLDGLKMAFAVKWPGAVHEGKGKMQPILDKNATPAQREALLSIMTGKETDEMATFFAVYSAMCDTIHDPVISEIRMDTSMAGRTASCEAKGIATGRGAPILNKATGKEHRVGLLMPDGFEFTRNEIGRGWSESSGAVPITLEDSYAQWSELHLNRHGVIKEQNKGSARS